MELYYCSILCPQKAHPQLFRACNYDNLSCKQYGTVSITAKNVATPAEQRKSVDPVDPLLDTVQPNLNIHGQLCRILSSAHICIMYCCTEMGYKVGTSRHASWLSMVARRDLTQPRAHLIAHICTVLVEHKNNIKTNHKHFCKLVYVTPVFL